MREPWHPTFSAFLWSRIVVMSNCFLGPIKGVLFLSATRLQWLACFICLHVSNQVQTCWAAWECRWTVEAATQVLSTNLLQHSHSDQLDSLPVTIKQIKKAAHDDSLLSKVLMSSKAGLRRYQRHSNLSSDGRLCRWRRMTASNTGVTREAARSTAFSKHQQ